MPTYLASRIEGGLRRLRRSGTVVTDVAPPLDQLEAHHGPRLPVDGRLDWHRLAGRPLHDVPHPPVVHRDRAVGEEGGEVTFRRRLPLEPFGEPVGIGPDELLVRGNAPGL